MNLKPSDLVRIIIVVPETHADAMREALGKAGAGTIGEYTHCCFSQKGTGRFMPSEAANPHIGTKHQLETVAEERIEAVCPASKLEQVLDDIKKAHPYEATIIDIYPIYQIGCKIPN